MTEAPKIPSGMIEVTKEEFYQALYADKRDIMPSISNPYYVEWRTKDRTLWGWETPGWKNPGDDKVHAIYPNAKINGDIHVG